MLPTKKSNVMKKLAVPTMENFKILGEIMYNFTGLEYYLNIVSNYYQSVAMGVERGHFFSYYYQVYNDVKDNIKQGQTFNYPLYKLGTTTPKPYIFNSL